MNVRKDETAGGAGYSNNEKEKKNVAIYMQRGVPCKLPEVVGN